MKGKVVVKRGRKTVGSATTTLAANATKTVKVKVRRLSGKVKRLAVSATMRGPVGKAATTKAAVRLARKKGSTGQPKRGGGGDSPTTPAADGPDGTYHGEGAGADWVMAIEGGVVRSFNGTMGLSCTKTKASENVPFSMAADDPNPTVGPDGSFQWEATSGYGFTKLKFSGRVADGKVTGNLNVEYRPPVSGADPITGMPRMEFEYCYGGRDYTLTRR